MKLLSIISHQKFWLKIFQLIRPKCNKHLKDFSFSQEFNSFGECLSWLRVLQRFQTFLKSDWWMDDWQQKQSAHCHAERSIFLYLNISLPRKLLLLSQLCIHKIFINVGTTASNSIGGALSLVCMRSWIIRAPWSINCTFLLQRPLQFIWISY